ncbi:MAG: YfhO family protein, partial [Oscillospiraceae bacterium]
LALEAIIGLLMSSILLLPSIMTIISNTRLSDNLWGFDMICYNNVQRYGLILESMFFPPDIPARPNFFPDSNSKWSSVSLFLPLFSMAGVFAFFKGVKKHWAKTLLSICVLLAFIPILNASFSAFNYSYYARWFYMPLLIMAMVTCIALENHEEHFPFGIKLNLAIVGAFSLIGVLPKKEDGKLIFFSLPPHPERFWAYVIIALIGIVLTYTLYTLSTKHKRFITIAVSMLIPFICVYSMFVIFTGKTEGNGYDVVAKQAIKWRPPQYAELEEQFFRIDSYDELDNLGMHWQMPTINAFHSVVPSSVTEYYVEIGEKRGVASRPKPEYIGIRALNSVKYQYKKANKT